MTNLAEELLLLALEDDSGRVTPSASGALEYGLAGAVLMDLVLQERLDLRSGNLVIANPSPTGDEILDYVLRQIEDSGKERSPEDWVGRAGNGNLIDWLLNRLVKKGVLRKEERRVPWVISRSRYPTRDGEPERRSRERVRAAVLEGCRPDVRVAALVSLIEACELVDQVFPATERDAVRERLEKFAGEDVLGDAVSDTISCVQAATQAAVIASITAAAATSVASCSTTSTSSC